MYPHKPHINTGRIGLVISLYRFFVIDINAKQKNPDNIAIKRDPLEANVTP